MTLESCTGCGCVQDLQRYKDLSAMDCETEAYNMRKNKGVKWEGYDYTIWNCMNCGSRNQTD